MWKNVPRKPNLFGPNLELRPAGAQFGGHVVNYVPGRCSEVNEVNHFN